METIQRNKKTILVRNGQCRRNVPGANTQLHILRVNEWHNYGQRDRYQPS